MEIETPTKAANEASNVAGGYAVLAKWAKEISPANEPGSIREGACQRILRKDRKLNTAPFPFTVGRVA